MVVLRFLRNLAKNPSRWTMVGAVQKISCNVTWSSLWLILQISKDVVRLRYQGATCSPSATGTEKISA